jgi:ABC-type amino acid transport substrate-binding protein
MNESRLVTTLIVALICSLSTPYAAAELAGSVLELKPWGYKNEQGEITGRHVAIVKAIENEAEIKLSFKLAPLKRMTRALATGTTDFGMLFLRDEYAQNVEVVNEVYDLSLYLLLQKDMSDVRLSELRSIGLIQGQENIGKDVLMQNGATNFSVYSPKEVNQLFLMLSKKRIEAAMYLGNTFDRYIKDSGRSKSDFGKSVLLQNRKAFFMMPKNSKGYSTEHVSRIRDAIETLSADGTLDRINSSAY